MPAGWVVDAGPPLVAQPVAWSATPPGLVVTWARDDTDRDAAAAGGRRCRAGRGHPRRPPRRRGGGDRRRRHRRRGASPPRCRRHHRRTAPPPPGWVPLDHVLHLCGRRPPRPAPDGAPGGGQPHGRRARPSVTGDHPPLYSPDDSLLALDERDLRSFADHARGRRADPRAVARLRTAGVIGDGGIDLPLRPVAVALAGRGPRMRLLTRHRGRVTITDAAVSEDGIVRRAPAAPAGRGGRPPPADDHRRRHPPRGAPPRSRRSAATPVGPPPPQTLRDWSHGPPGVRHRRPVGLGRPPRPRLAPRPAVGAVAVPAGPHGTARRPARHRPGRPAPGPVRGHVRRVGRRAAGDLAPDVRLRRPGPGPHPPAPRATTPDVPQAREAEMRAAAATTAAP